MNARRESKERNLTWRIQEDNNCWTLLEHFLESISSILYVVSKLGKSSIQHFKWCTIWRWNEEDRAIESQSHQAEGQFGRLRNQPLVAKSQGDGYEISLWLRNGDLQLAKFRSPACEISQPILHACEIHLSASRYLRLTLLDFSSNICCLNPHYLLVIHQS